MERLDHDRRHLQFQFADGFLLCGIRRGRISLFEALPGGVLGLGGLEQAPGGKPLEVPSYEDPALAAFDGGQGGDLTRVTAYRWIRLEPDAGTRSILSIGGKALLVGTSYRSGNVFTLATAPQ